MSAPDYEALAASLRAMESDMIHTLNTDPDLKARARQDLTDESLVLAKAAAALRRAARIEAAAKEAVQMFRPIDGFGPSKAIEKLREALEADTE